MRGECTQTNLTEVGSDEHFLQLMSPVWDGATVYHESIMFVPNPKTGEIDAAPLLYLPEKILSVSSSDFVVKYREEIDYTVENGCICRQAGGNIPAWSYDDYYPPQPSDIPIASTGAAGRYVCYNANGLYHRMQLAVTYRHQDSWCGVQPHRCKAELPETVRLLSSKQLFTVVYYGDSILEGCDASGFHRQAPYQPSVTQLVTKKLQKEYAHPNIAQFNTAVGGKDSAWGRVNAQERVAAYRPDLVVIGFGMNDSGAGISLGEYKDNLQAILQTTRAGNPAAEFILISPTVPSPDCQGWTKLQPSYQQALETLAQELRGVVVAPMTKVQQFLLSRKRYADVSGNGVNHPNDFMARIHAQVIVQCLL